MAEMGLPRLQNRHSGRVNMRKQFFKIVVIPSDTARGQCSCCSRPKRERGARTGINCDRIYAATPRPRTLNPAVTPPSRATSFLPLAPAIISTTTIYFHSFNAAKFEFLERDSRKIWMIRSPSSSPFLSLLLSEGRERENENFSILGNFSIFQKAWQGSRCMARLLSCCDSRHVARVRNYSYSFLGHKLAYRDNRIHPENISWKCADASWFSREKPRKEGRENGKQSAGSKHLAWVGWR